MCGIAGYATLGTDRPVDPQYIEPMVHALHHRGPDEWGVGVYPQVAYGNARLSIIDLAHGRQPIANADGTTEVVYNGELYNYPELRAELEAKGYTFRTNSDTEALVHLYDEEGIDFLKRLNGMFGLALYDKERERLVLARDRFGVKPLFYTYRDGMLSFASEIKALRVLPHFDTTLDPEGVSVFLGLFYIPDPWTIYKHVKKLRPGHYLVLSKDGLEEGEFYDVDFSYKTPISFADARDRTAALVRQSIKRQLLSDVPVGVLLSGGLDSRSMLAAACEQIPGTHSFTITFAEEVYNEGGEAAYWAKVYGSPHHEMLFTEHDFCAQLLQRQRHLDEPYALWCNVATGALARFIHEHGFKVVLSGEGGDEVFLGYPTIHAANIARYYRIAPKPIRKLIESAALRLPAGSSRLPLSFKIKSFVTADDPDLYRTFFGFKEVVRYKLWPELLTPDAFEFVGGIDPYLAFSQYRKKIEDWHFVDAMSYLDFKVFLPGCSFIGNDNAYMSASVETRVPMMDNDLVDFVASWPVDVRFNPLKLKVVLRDALQTHFPPPLPHGEKPPAYRKNGFEIPGNHWILRDPFKSLAQRIFSREMIAKTGFFQPAAVQRLLDEQLAAKQNHERVLQAIMSLTLFLDGAYALP